MTNEDFTGAVLAMTQTLYRVSCTQLSSAADREDAVQETLRRAWEKRFSLRDDRMLQTWMIRILLNVCHDIRRKNKRMVPMEEVLEIAAPEEPEAAELRRAIFRLEEKERTAILLHYIEGYDVRQVAAMLRIPPGTVKSRLSRGRRLLKEMLQEDVFDEE